MSTTTIEEPLAEILSSYCDVNAIEMVDYLREDIQNGKIPTQKVELIREQLINAIENTTITPSQYKELTGENEYSTQEKLQSWLRELFTMIFPEEPISSDL